MAFAGFRHRLEQARLDPDMRNACLAITDILSEIALGDGHHLGLHFFAKELTEAEQSHLLPALSILCTMDAPILSMHSYLDAEDGQYHLSDDEFGELIRSGNFAHPGSGEPIPKPLEHVRIFYSIRDEVRDES